MNRFGTLLGLVSALAIGGCDNGPSFTVTEEPAGANCPTGGFRIEADGAVFYSCDGQASTETVAAGAEGNPCIGPALRVTVPVEDGTTRYAYVCQPLDVDPIAEGILTLELDAMIAMGNVQCACIDDPTAQATCESQVSLYETVAHVSETCISEVVTVVGPLPEADRPAVECIVNAYAAVIECFDAIPLAECTMETEADITACQELGAAAEACADPSDAFDDWADRAQGLGQFLGCPILGGGV